MTTDLELLEEVGGEGQAEMLRGWLEAQGIPVTLSQEGVGKVYALTVGAFGRVQLLVPRELLERARQLLEAYYAGEFVISEGQDESSQNEQEGETPS